MGRYEEKFNEGRGGLRATTVAGFLVKDHAKVNGHPAWFSTVDPTGHMRRIAAGLDEPVVVGHVL